MRGRESDVVRARARVVSRRSDAVTFETVYHWCALTVSAYADDRRSAPPVWTSGQPWPGQPPSACSHVARGVTLMPGDVEDFEAWFPTSDILGPMLPDGRYHFTVVLHVDKLLYAERPSQSTPELAAGSLVLRR